MKGEDIYFLVSVLHRFSNKWKEIGSALGFQSGEVQGFSQLTNAQSLQALLTQWSQWPIADHSDTPTMERLCDALRSGMVGLGATANDLYERRYNLPSQQRGND